MMPIDPLKPIKTFHCAIHINISIYIFQCKATEGAWNSIASTACHTGSPPLLLTPHCGRTCDGWRDQVLNIIGAVVSSVISPVQCPHLTSPHCPVRWLHSYGQGELSANCGYVCISNFLHSASSSSEIWSDAEMRWESDEKLRSGNWKQQPTFSLEKIITCTFWQQVSMFCYKVRNLLNHKFCDNF